MSTSKNRDFCAACRYGLAHPVPNREPFERVRCHQCGVALGCTRPCCVGDAMYSDGTFGGGEIATCAEAHAPFALMGIQHGPRYQESLIGYLCPACADAMMRSWEDDPEQECRLAIVPRPTGAGWRS